MNNHTGPVVNQLSKWYKNSWNKYFIDWVAYWRCRYGCSSPSTKVLHDKSKLLLKMLITFSFLSSCRTQARAPSWAPALGRPEQMPEALHQWHHQADWEETAVGAARAVQAEHRQCCHPTCREVVGPLVCSTCLSAVGRHPAISFLRQIRCLKPE